MPKATRLQKIENHQLVITNALSAMSMMGNAVPRNPGQLLDLAKEINDASAGLLKQCKKYEKEMRKPTNA